MKVYVVVEWSIDYFYKIWGVFTSKAKADEFVEKLKRLSRVANLELLDGELYIDEVELDDDSVYVVECVRYDATGRVVKRYYSRLTKDKDYFDEGSAYECKVVVEDEG